MTTGEELVALVQKNYYSVQHLVAEYNKLVAREQSLQSRVAELELTNSLLLGKEMLLDNRIGEAVECLETSSKNHAYLKGAFQYIDPHERINKALSILKGEGQSIPVTQDVKDAFHMQRFEQLEHKIDVLEQRIWQLEHKNDLGACA